LRAEPAWPAAKALGEDCFFKIKGIVTRGELDLDTVCADKDTRKCFDRVMSAYPKLLKSDCLPVNTVPVDIWEKLPILWDNLMDQAYCVKSHDGK